MTQPGYDAMADRYATAFPEPYEYPVERYAAAAFADAARAREGITVDVGCGIGHVTADLAARGLDVLGCEPSAAMLDHARRAHPALTFTGDDAASALPQEGAIAAIIARFSLIHLDPTSVADVLRKWSDRVVEGTPVLVAVQASDEPGPPIPFDHLVAPAWRWHPDELSGVLQDNGFDEDWRIVYRDSGYRFPMAQVLAHRR